MVRARVDDNIKQRATVVLAAIGLTVSDAFRIMLIRTAQDKALPFHPLIPNKVTIKAMKNARAGIGLTRFNSADEMWADLNADA